ERTSCDALLGRSKADHTLRLRAIDRDGMAVGIAVVRLHTPDRSSAIIELVVTAPDYARRGSGMTAAALLEAELRASKITRVFASAPAVHGIAVYFWIRLGYRPLLRPEWPCEPAGVVWMLRDV
ncbi:MAG: GNAT family N-acetyltransferase, partial [Gemmatimonadaceae bacterium]